MVSIITTKRTGKRSADRVPRLVIKTIIRWEDKSMGPAPLVDGGVEVRNVEVDQSKEVDDLHTKLSDGRIIEKSKRVFLTRKANLKDGRPVELTLDNVIYERKGGALVRLNGKSKLSKAEKKAAKRTKVAERRAAHAP
jgi:hypothetical protein